MKFLLLTMFFTGHIFANDYMYEEQKLTLFDVKNKKISESLSYRIINTDNKLKRISVETTEVTPEMDFKNRYLYRIYQGPQRKDWILEDTMNQSLKMVLTITNPDKTDWPIRSYRAIGPTPEGGKQVISFEQTLAYSKGRIDYTDWKGQPKGHVILEGKAIQEAQYLSKLKDIKH